MTYDFTTVTQRKNCGASKWELMYNKHPEVPSDVIPMSVADMEFKTAPEIVNGLKTFLDESILGYTEAYGSFLESVVEWQKKRHNWRIKKDWIINTTGVVGALNAAIKATSKPGDGILNFRPTYPPFGEAIKANNRIEVNVPLIEEDGYYTINFQEFERQAAQPNNKVLLFCSPHNPIGRVWTVEELKKLERIVLEHDLFVISDEIWYDIVMPEYEHTVLATLSPEIADKLITCTSPSKSFNIAGLSISNIIVSNDELRHAFEVEVNQMHIGMINVMGYKACELAYTLSAEWLNNLLEVIHTNQQIVTKFFVKHYPSIISMPIEGTYVQWLDCRALQLTNDELDRLAIKADFHVNPGYSFGEEGSGFLRINLALPQTELENNLQRFLNELKNV